MYGCMYVMVWYGMLCIVMFGMYVLHVMYVMYGMYVM